MHPDGRIDEILRQPEKENPKTLQPSAIVNPLRSMNHTITTPRFWHHHDHTDSSNRIVLLLELWRAAGMPGGQRLKASQKPGRIVLEVEPKARVEVVKRGQLKL